MSRGYFCVGVENSKSTFNMGTLWRSAYAFDAAMLFTIGRRYQHQISDTLKAPNNVPLLHFKTFDEFFEALPFSCPLVGIELDPRAKELRKFHHPERAAYLLGAEDHGLSRQARERCHQLIVLPGKHVLNVATAGSIVLAHRIMQQERETFLTVTASPRVKEQLSAHL